jgi:ketosteroid isomerase-like protein
MTREDVQAWLDRYVAAWETYDPAAIGDLFSEDAEYRYHPADAPVVGRTAIVRAWVEPDPATPASTPDEPGTYAAHYEPYAVEGDRGVAVGWSRYWTDATRAVEESTYDNCFLLAFDAAGRCRSFTEFYRRRG